MSEIEVDIDTLEMTELRVLSALQTGQNPGAVSSLLKLRVSEIRQAVTRLGVEVIGNDGLYVEPVRPLYRLNEAPGIPEEIAAGRAGISQRPGVHDLRRLVGDPAGDRGEDGAGDLYRSVVSGASSQSELESTGRRLRSLRTLESFRVRVSDAPRNDASPVAIPPPSHP